MSGLAPSERAEYVDEFKPRRGPFDHRDDPWFAYVDEADVQSWMEFLATVMSTAIDRFLVA
jgi:hypothetical protein